MAPKRRLLLEEEDESEEAEYTRIRKVMWRVWTDDIKPDFINTFHGLLSQFTSNSPGSLQGSVIRPSDPSGSFVPSQYQLHFENELPKTLYTDNKFFIKVSLRDSTAKERITSGSLSSVRIEVVVLHGDFGFEEQEIQLDKYFDDTIVRARDGKRSLLIGCRQITLRGGVGTLCDVAFTDNSRWDRTGKFRLGAKALLHNCCNVRVQEAISEAFTVKDNRVKATEKRHPPLLDDEVWCLERIKKGGTYHKKLLDRGIKTVKDFLKFSVTDDRCKLQEIFKEKTLEAVIRHARECVPDSKHYWYKIEENSTIIVFNSTLEVVGAYFSGHDFQPLQCLTDDQKKSLEKLKMLAYRNKHDMAEIESSHIDVLQESIRRGNASIPVSILKIHECPYINECLNLREGLLEVPSCHGKQIHTDQGSLGKYPNGITGHQMDPQCSNPMSSNGNNSHHRDQIPCSSFCGSTSSSIPSAPVGQLDDLAMCNHFSFHEDSYHDAEQTFSSGNELHPFLQDYSCPTNGYHINEAVYVELTSHNTGLYMTYRHRIARIKWGALGVILKFKISTRKRFAAKRSHMKRHANWVKLKAVLRLGISTYYTSKLTQWMLEMVDDDPLYT